MNIRSLPFSTPVTSDFYVTVQYKLNASTPRFVGNKQPILNPKQSERSSESVLPLGCYENILDFMLKKTLD